VLTQLGQSDVILGTVEYLAPEQALSSQVDGRADIYSLGATLYFLLTGRPPFPDGDARTKILQLANERPAPIRQLAPNIPHGLADVVEKMLAKEPEERYQWASEAARALAPWATPAEFLGRFFSRPASTVANEGSPTAALSPDAVQPLPGVTTATPPPCDPITGTVEIGAASDPTEAQTAAELTLPTRAANEGDESPLDADEGETAELDPRLTRVMYGLLAAVLAWAGYVLFMH